MCGGWNGGTSSCVGISSATPVCVGRPIRCPEKYTSREMYPILRPFALSCTPLLPPHAVRLLAGLLIACGALFRPALAQEGTEPIVITDLLKLQQLGDVALSPDGRQVAYTVQSIVPGEAEENGEPTYTYRTHLYLAPVDGGTAPRQLTRGDRSASQPAWHPSGERLAFVRPVDGTPQVFILPLTGGEAYPLTDFEHGATAPRWSPDGTKLLFTATLDDADVRALMDAAPPWPDERPGRAAGDTGDAEADPDGSLAEIRAWLARNARHGNPRVFNRLDLQGETDLAPQPTYRHLFVLHLDTTGVGPQPVTRGFYSFGGGAWMPDGERVVFSGARVADQHPDRVRDSDLYVAGLDGAAPRTLLDLDGYALFDPQVAPDGHSLAFLARRLDDPGFAQTELGLLELPERGAAPELLTLDFDRSVGAPRWGPNGWHLYFTAPSEGDFPLFRIPAYATPPLSAAPAPDTPTADTLTAAPDSLAVADSLAAAPDSLAVTDSLAADTRTTPAAPPGRQIEQLTGPALGVRSYDVGRASVFYVATRPANPYELYASSLSGAQERRLTAHNATWLAGKRLSTPTAHTLRRDTLTIPYWVMRPASFEEGRTYPLLLQIHGGPAAMWGPGEATMWFEFQYFAARGYGVVFGNPRGSGGYGYAFQHANYQDWGTGPAGDVLAIADTAATLPWVDPDRQVVTGGSYAGYLTAWIVAHDDRFQAAVAQRGVYDLDTFLGEGNAWRLVPAHFGGYPWDDTRPEPPTDRPLPLPEVARAPEADGLPAGVASVVLGDAAPLDSLAAAAGPPDTLRAAPDTLLALGDTTVVADTRALSPADTTLAAADTLAAPAALTPADTLSARALLIRNSPITYVDQIRTPLLIIHGDHDLRTGVIQSEMLYKSLKILGRPVEYVRYPDAGHELSRSGDPKQRIDRILRIYEFMARYVE